MPRALAILFALLTAHAALADGIVLPRAIDPAAVTIPDQQALISFTDGVQTLAIETRFTAGAGSEFAWVVPTPSIPEVSAGTLGTFPALRAIFAPTLHRFDWPIPTIVVGTVILLIALDFMIWRKRSRVLDLLAILIVVLTAGVFALPTLGKPRGLQSDHSGVQVHKRSIIGAFEVAVVSSAEGSSITDWLSANGFAAPPALTPVILDYAAEGWCFVASRLRRDAAGQALMTPHPLVLRFATSQPVYPMRLTAHGVAKALELELCVFGAGTAAAPGMKVVCSDRVLRQHTGARSASDDGLEVVHSALEPLTMGAPHATLLRGSFTPAQMTSDLPITIGLPQRRRPWVVSHPQRIQASVAVAVCTAALGILVLNFRNRGAASCRRLPRQIAWTLLASVAAGAAVAAFLPSMDTISGRKGGGYSRLVWAARYALGFADRTMTTFKDAATIDEARQRVAEWLRAEEIDTATGDGPGQYLIVQRDTLLHMHYVDHHGRELVESVGLLTDPRADEAAPDEPPPR
jgi:hypothetical protein